MSWLEKTLLAGGVPQATCECHDERGLLSIPKEGPGLRYPVPCPLGIFGSMGFPPGAIHFSPCLLWEGYILAENLEALPESQHLKINQLSLLLALTLRNQIPLVNKGKPA